MTHYSKAFKRYLAEAFYATGDDFLEFSRRRGMRDFMSDAEAWTPQRIAVQAVDQLCERDGGSWDRLVCFAVTLLMDKATGQSTSDASPAADLAAIVAAGGGHPQVLAWLKANYP